MKRVIFCLILTFVSVFFLCSFSTKTQENTNKSLQITLVQANNNLDDIENENNSENFIIDIDGKLEEIFRDFKSIVPKEVPIDVNDISGTAGIGEVVEYIISLFDNSGVIKSFCILIGIALLFCLAELIFEDAGEISSFGKSAAALILSLPVLYMGKEMILSVKQGIVSGSEFFGEIIPILSSVAAIGIGGLTAGTAAATMSLSLAFVLKVLVNNLMPMATIIFSASILSNVDTGQGVNGVAKGIRGWFNFIIGFISVIIVATLGTQTIIASSHDGLTLRSAKYALSGMIPIVGSTVSGALSLLISGAKLLSGTIGITTVAVLFYFMGSPLIMLLFYRFCIGACITLTSFSGASAGERFFSSMRGAIDCLIAVLAFSLMIFIFEIIILAAVIGRTV